MLLTSKWVRFLVRRILLLKLKENLYINFILQLKCFQDKKGTLENFPIIHYSTSEKQKQRNKIRTVTFVSSTIIDHYIMWIGGSSPKQGPLMHLGQEHVHEVELHWHLRGILRYIELSSFSVLKIRPQNVHYCVALMCSPVSQLYNILAPNAVSAL